MRRAAAIILLLSMLPLASGCGGATSSVPPPTPRPLRVMSTNQCLDQLVLALLPPARIASITWLSQEPGGSLLPAAARRVGTNHGTAEEVLAQHPDLVITGDFTTPALRAMLKRLRYPMIEVPSAGTIGDIRRITRQVAAAVGEPARGEALIARMDARLATLARHPGSPVPVVAWDHSGFAAGRGSLFDAILTLAGARNLADAPGGFGARRPDVETLLAADPVLLVQGSADPRAASLGDAAIHHPLVRRLWGNRTLFVPQIAYVCGTPLIADAAWRLRGELGAAVARTGTTAPMPDRLR